MAGLVMGTVMMAIIMNFVNMMVVTVVDIVLIHGTAQNAFAMTRCAIILQQEQVKIIYLNKLFEDQHLNRITLREIYEALEVACMQLK